MPSEVEQGCNIVQDAQMLEWFLNLQHLNDLGKNPVNYEYFAKQQVQDEKLQQIATRNPDNHAIKTLNGHAVLCYAKIGNEPDTK